MSRNAILPSAPKRCPVCGVAMVGRRAASTSRETDYFECLNCNLVVDLSGSGEQKPGPKT